jgi:ATP-dependent Clp protease adaptor protein ClpS
MKNFDKLPNEIDTDSDILLAPEEVAVTDKQIILFDDDIHTFEYVIECLIKICKHNNLQAEQCTYLVHYKGKCSVKRGNYEELEPICTALLEKGLTAEIQ